MQKNLKDYFPMIRERQEVLKDIFRQPHLVELFQNWNHEQQEEFLDFCTGVKGLRLLYDGFFKEIMNPETKPQRMNDFLSQILNQEVKVLHVLPTDSTRLADESSLVIMDIVVELSDGSIANIEVQKIGYHFPGQRCACYSADLLLRQYKRIRDEKKKKFSYRDIKNVYTIVLFDHSPSGFKNYPDVYYHYFEQKSNTGLEIDLLQKYIFITLDIYQKVAQNKDITNKRDAWLTLLSADDPETIIQLISRYPEFQGIYEEAYTICLNMENIMGIFSEELYELDKNTVQYMIDEMQDTINEQKDTISTLQSTLDNAILYRIKLLKEKHYSNDQIIEDLHAQYNLSKAQLKEYLIP